MALPQIAGILAALPKIVDLLDKLIGALSKWKHKMAQRALDKRLEERRSARKALDNAKTDKGRRAALRRFRRLGL